MWKQKFALGTSGQFGCSDEQQLRMFKAAGFDGFFTGWRQDKDLKALAAVGREQELVFQSVHAPYQRCNHLWESPGQEGQAALEELLTCLRDCAEAGTDLVVAHAYIGFENHAPNQLGIDRYGILVEEARRLGLRLALENTEGEEYLDALMAAFREERHIGFCWDAGHELCYNRGRDMLEAYGQRLFGTHLNDNLGISRFDGRIFWTDDLHLLPFDGIRDWAEAARRLDKCGFRDILTFELNTKSKPNRHENDKYGAMPLEQYLAEVYSRACRIAALRQLP